MRQAALAVLVLVGVAPIRAHVRAAVQASRAQVEVLTVDVHAKRLRLDVSVLDPAAYLKHRYAPVVETVYRLAGRFRFISLRVVDARSRREVLRFRQTPSHDPHGTYVTTWHVARPYIACARDLPLDWELDPERVAPPCPAR